MKRNKILIGLAALLLTGCRKDGLPTEGDTFSLIAPIEVLTGNTVLPTRALSGDPGINDELPPPANVYLFAWIQTYDDQYELYYTSRTGLTNTNWAYLRGEQQEDQNSRYRLIGNIELKFNSSVKTVSNGTQVGRTYAIATTRALTNAQLQAILTSSYQGVLTNGDESMTFNTSPDATLQAATASLSGWNSMELRDLYSTPTGDGSGLIVYSSEAEAKASCEQIRLYHCAAKIDFLWEVPASQQATTSVSTIQVTQLPTTCKLFQPTANPTGNETSVTLTTDEGSKWIGRNYFYALQPAMGTITYNVDFTGSRPDLWNKTFTPTQLNTIFTGWYRVVATVGS